jgi:hypothetical protein
MSEAERLAEAVERGRRRLAEDQARLAAIEAQFAATPRQTDPVKRTHLQRRMASGDH